MVAELTQLTKHLHAGGVPYALCGGLAMAVWGKPRATIDIDLLVPAEHLDPALRVAATCGYRIAANPMTFAGGVIEIRRVSKVFPRGKEVLPLDFLLVTPALRSVWEDRQEVKWQRRKLSVVSRRGMIRLKSLRGSGQDQDDIKALEDEQ